MGSSDPQNMEFGAQNMTAAGTREGTRRTAVEIQVCVSLGFFRVCFCKSFVRCLLVGLTWIELIKLGWNFLQQISWEYSKQLPCNIQSSILVLLKPKDLSVF